ncbi:MAG: hypothetical protein FWC13_09105 [Oscillospiraceae bacterium]|nr:hypothetical protein [Oscillospiraceae bacterium]
MSKIKLERNEYPTAEKYYLIDNELTLRAKGLLTQLRAIPETLDFNLESLTNLTKDEIQSIRSATNELESLGYLNRYQKRGPYGQFLPVEYTIYDRPQDNPIYCAEFNIPIFDDDYENFDYETDEENDSDDEGWNITEYDGEPQDTEQNDDYTHIRKIMELMDKIFDEVLKNTKITARKTKHTPTPKAQKLPKPPPHPTCQGKCGDFTDPPRTNPQSPQQQVKYYRP